MAAKAIPAKSLKRKLRDGEEDELNVTQDGTQQADAAETVTGDAPMQLAQAETGAVGAGGAGGAGTGAGAVASAGAAAGSGGGDDPVPAPAPAADTTAPTANLTSATDNVGSVTGALTGGQTTDDTALVLAGTCEAGSTVNVYNGTTLLGAATVTGTGWSYSATVANGTTYQFNAKETDAAGNTSAATSNFTVTGDTAAPTFTSGATASFAENGTGTAYDATADGDSGVAYTIGGTDAALFNINAATGAVTFITSPSYEAPADNGGNNIYDITVTATDTAGNATNQAVALTVTDVVDAGQAVIDLGAYGKLIAPVNVDGNWYCHWDRSGDGTSANSGSLNGGADYTNHNVPDGIFTQDINGATGGGGNTTNTYRYATLNGVKVALPTHGEAAVTTGYRSGTAIDNNPAGETNPTYDDLLAIWDGYNGTGTGTGNSGTPSGWQFFAYWSATPSTNVHAGVYLPFGVVSDADDTINYYVALQVL